MAALAVVRDLRSPRSLDSVEDASAYQDNLLAEFVMARSAHGVADATVRGDVATIEEFFEFAGVWAWEVEAAHADRFLAVAQRDKAVRTRRIKACRIATFYRFIEVRYQGEIAELCGRVVVSPIDGINRPTHTGEFSVRIPPTARELTGFFTRWRDQLPEARKWRTAARNYAMARVTAEVGVRATELCMLTLDDCYFDHGPLGKIHVRAGKGSRGSGPRERLVPMLGHARDMLIWWITEIRGEFNDDFERPHAPLFPSERGGRVSAESFRLALVAAAAQHLSSPRTLTPHVLRHACASELYATGVSLAAIQQLLGHLWLTTTIGYVHVAETSIETEYQAAAERAAARFV